VLIMIVYRPRLCIGRITTKGKMEMAHGRLEARAKVPHARGLWPVRVPTMTRRYPQRESHRLAKISA
jgi:hypothetical protein